MSVNTVFVPYITLRHELSIDPRLRMGTFLLFGFVLVFSSLFVDGRDESLFVDGRDESLFVDCRDKNIIKRSIINLEKSVLDWM
jgi:hypothetical protein